MALSQSPAASLVDAVAISRKLPACGAHRFGVCWAAMRERIILAWLGAAALCWGCRTSEPQAGSTWAREPVGAPSANAVPAPSSAAPVVSAEALLRALGQPPLKPIAPKPFPEGVDQATLCEAIESKEPDLWLRFGHFIPLFETGVLYVLNTGAEQNEKLYDYIARKYQPGFNSLLASCGERTLVYIRVMYGDGEYNGKLMGRMHLAQQLEKKFGLKVLENIQVEGDEKRLGAYCRADAELCDALVKLHPGNKGLGLCSHATSRCPDSAGTREMLLSACEKIPRSALACTKYSREPLEAAACAKQVQAALCP